MLNNLIHPESIWKGIPGVIITLARHLQDSSKLGHKIHPPNPLLSNSLNIYRIVLPWLAWSCWVIQICQNHLKLFVKWQWSLVLTNRKHMSRIQADIIFFYFFASAYWTHSTFAKNTSTFFILNMNYMKRPFLFSKIYEFMNKWYCKAQNCQKKQSIQEANYEKESPGHASDD